MPRRKLSEEKIRKIAKLGDSYALTIPVSIMRELGWKHRRKVVVEKWGEGIIIKDEK